MSQDPVVRSDALDATLSQSPVVISLVELSKQHGRIIKWLIRAVVFGAAVLVGVVYVAWQAHEAANSASQASSQTHVNCLSANQARATQRQLWTFILSFPPPPGETAAEKHRRIHETAQFKVFVQKRFAPLNCAATSPHVVPSGGLPKPVTAPSSARPSTPGPTAAGPPVPMQTAHATSQPTTRPQSKYTASAPPTHSSSPSPTAHPTPTPSPTRTPLCVPVIKKCLAYAVRLLLW